MDVFELLKNSLASFLDIELLWLCVLGNPASTLLPSLLLMLLPLLLLLLR